MFRSPIFLLNLRVAPRPPANHGGFDAIAGLEVVPAWRRQPAQERHYVSADMVLAQGFKGLIHRRIAFMRGGIQPLLPYDRPLRLAR
jgi:hypothetical protein